MVDVEPKRTFVNVNRLVFSIGLVLAAVEWSFATVGCVASGSAELLAGCNRRLQQTTRKRPAATHEPPAPAAHRTQDIADVIALSGKRKRDR